MLACMSDHDIRLRWVEDADDLSAALALRVAVFCGEQGVPYDDEHDPLDDDAAHLVALAGDRDYVVATLRLLREEDTARIGRVAVLAGWRHRGIASRMLALAV